jgi:hypothetical protein
MKGHCFILEPDHEGQGVNRYTLAAVLFLGLLPFPAPAASAPIEVRIGVQLDQVTNVDQKAENYSIVGTLLMSWEDEAYAFDPAECDCDEKLFSTSQFEEYTRKKRLTWPRFLFYNQQGNRWIQEDVFVVKPDGQALYVERSTLTLQAPDFNFVKYPFDTQKFDVHVVSLHKEKEYVFVADPEHSRLGTQLGEEEWRVGAHRTYIDSVELGPTGQHSRFTFTFPAQRHLDYYVFRIFLPLFLIVIVAYATFYMKDYTKRIDYSAANLMTFVMFNFTVGAELPRLGYMTFTDSILVLAFVITAVTVIANVIMKRLSVTGQEDVVRKWDGTILWGYPVLYVLGFGSSWLKFFG